MSKRMYKLSNSEIGIMLSAWLREQYPELGDVPDDTPMKLRINRRGDEFTVVIG